MYTLTSTLSLSRAIDSVWSDINLGNELLRNLFNNYNKVYLTVLNTITQETSYVDIDDLKQNHYTFSGTLNDFLILNANNTLPTIQTLPNQNIKTVQYIELIRHGYKLDLSVAGESVPDNYPVDEKNDLSVYRPYYNTDLSVLENTSLLTVNGYIHNTLYENGSLYIKDGGKTIKISKHCHVGCLSFLDVCNIRKKIINNLSFELPDYGLRKKVHFTIDEDATNKAIFMVLGGYLLFPDNDIFYSTGNSSYVIDLNRIPFLERLMESSYYLDLSYLGITEHIINQDMLNISELNSDEFLTKYFLGHNTFIVITDKDKLVNNKIFIRHSNIPGSFISYQDPTLPLITNYGKITEYWKNCDNGYYNLKVVDTFYRNYVISHQQYNSLVNITDQLLPNLPYYNTHGYLLQMSFFNLL